MKSSTCLEISFEILQQTWDVGWFELPVPLEVPRKTSDVILSLWGFSGAWCGRWRFAGVRIDRQ